VPIPPTARLHAIQVHNGVFKVEDSTLGTRYLRFNEFLRV